MKHCEHFSDKIVKHSKGEFATVCERCVTDEDLAREGYKDATYSEVRFLHKTNFTPPKLNPEYLKVSRKEQVGVMLCGNAQFKVYE